MMKTSAVKWLSIVVDKKKINIFVLLIAQAILGASGVFYALFLRNIIDNAVAKNRQGFFAFFFAIIALIAGQIVLRAFIRYVDELTRASLENSFKHRLFSNLMKKDYASVTSTHSGEWINRLTSDTVVCANGMVEILPGVVGMVVKLSSALIMMLIIEPRFGYIMLPAGLLIAFITYSFRKILKKLHKNIQEKDGKLRVHFQESLGSLLVVKSYAAEEQIGNEATEKMAAHKVARMKRVNLSNMCNMGFQIAMNGIYVLGIGYCGYGILIGTLSYGTFTAMLQLISQIQTPFANITGYLPKYYSMIASAERLMEIEVYAEDCSGSIKSIDEVQEFYNNRFIKIGFKDACFTYRPTGENSDDVVMPVVMKNISFEIGKGEYIAFTGHSGCGKSTMFKIMMCLYSLDSGERYLIGDKKHELTSEWHRLFAFVPQGNHLMTGTIREIISLADKKDMNNEDRINNALKIACADEFVSELEDGIDTVLGERGTGLSEGQMQRIAIARAIFSDNPVMLLDEATSALDETTEGKVLDNLKRMTNKTVLIVTHRPAALDICDRVLEFTEEGVRWNG